MKQLFFFLAMVACTAASAQTSSPTSSNKVATGGNAAQYTYVRGGLYVDSNLFFPVLKAINDTTLVGIDATGKAYRIPKAAIQKWIGGSGTARTFQQQNAFEGGHLEMGLNSNIILGSKGPDGDSVALITESAGGSYGGKFIAGIKGFQSGQVAVGISGAAMTHGNALDYGYVAANRYGNSMSTYQGGVEKNNLTITADGVFFKKVRPTSVVPDSMLVLIDGELLKAKLPAYVGSGGSGNLQSVLSAGNRMLPTQSLEVYSSSAGRPIVSVRADNAKSGALDITNADSGRYMTLYGNMIAASDGMLGKAAKFYLPLDEGGVIANNLTLATRDYVNAHSGGGGSSVKYPLDSILKFGNSSQRSVTFGDTLTLLTTDENSTIQLYGDVDGASLFDPILDSKYGGLSLRFSNNKSLHPFADNSNDLGTNSLRFRKLYLSQDLVTGTIGNLPVSPVRFLPRTTIAGKDYWRIFIDGGIRYVPNYDTAGAISAASGDGLSNSVNGKLHADSLEVSVSINGSNPKAYIKLGTDGFILEDGNTNTTYSGKNTIVSASNNLSLVGANNSAYTASDQWWFNANRTAASVGFNFNSGISLPNSPVIARSIDLTDGTTHAGISVDQYGDVYMNSNRGIYVNTTLMPLSYQTLGTSSRRFGSGYFEQIDAQGIITGSTTYPNVSAPAAPANGCIIYASGNHLYVICAGESSPTMLH